MAEHLFAMFAQFPGRTHIAGERHARDSELFAERTDRGVPITHGCLGEPDLGLAELEFPPAFAAASPRRL